MARQVNDDDPSRAVSQLIDCFTGCSWPTQVFLDHYVLSYVVNRLKREYVKGKYNLHMLKVTISLPSFGFSADSQLGSRRSSRRSRYFQCTYRMSKSRLWC